MVKTLELYGTILNRPQHYVSASYHWPDGMSYKEAEVRINQFLYAFENVTWDISFIKR